MKKERVDYIGNDDGGEGEERVCHASRGFAVLIAEHIQRSADLSRAVMRGRGFFSNLPPCETSCWFGGG